MFTSDTTYTTRGNMIEMKVTGGAELMKKFQSIKAEMYKGFGAALLAGSFPVSNAAKELAPKKSGNLARSIHIGTKTKNITEPQPDADGLTMRQMPADMGAVATVGNSLKNTGKAEVLIGTDVVYAGVQEFTEYDHKIGFSPYLRPAIDSNRKEVEDEVKRAVKMVIAKASIGVKDVAT